MTVRKCSPGTSAVAVITFALLANTFTPLAFAKKRPSAEGTNVGNWYSIEMEKEIGAGISAALERSVPLLVDTSTQGYLDLLTQALARNSNTQFAITVRVIDANDVYSETLPGGHQYLTRGLLLRAQNEGELASALARGIAHTALRSATRLETKGNLMQMMAIPLIYLAQDQMLTSKQGSNLAAPLTLLKFQREDELAADVLAVQYVYKAGYDTKCFNSFIPSIWPANERQVAFSAFPTTKDRLKAIDKEISRRLPNRADAVVTTPDFAAFKAHLLTLDPPKSEPAASTSIRPTLLRSNSPSQ